MHALVWTQRRPIFLSAESTLRRVCTHRNDENLIHQIDESPDFVHILHLSPSLLGPSRTIERFLARPVRQKKAVVVIRSFVQVLCVVCFAEMVRDTALEAVGCKCCLSVVHQV
jgi:hypothetical protein